MRAVRCAAGRLRRGGGGCQTLTRAQEALRRLAASNQPVSIARLATEADVSRAWLYTQPDIRAEVDRLRGLTRPTPVASPTRSSEQSLLQRLQLAHQRIRELDTDNRELRNQIAQLYGQLRVQHQTDGAGPN